jgi:hypothetical protein
MQHSADSLVRQTRFRNVFQNSISGKKYTSIFNGRIDLVIQFIEVK